MTPQPELAEDLYSQGSDQHRLGDLGAAEISFKKLLALHPGHLLGKLSLGLVMKDQEKIQDAQRLFAEGLAQSGEALLQAAFAYNLGLLQHERGLKQEALVNFALASRLVPSGGAADLARAEILDELQRTGEALGMLESLIRREPLNESAHNAYNDLLHRHGRDADFLKSYDRAPVTAPLQLGKADFLLKAGRQEEAHALYAALAEREPGNLDAILGAAAALNQLGRPDAALAALERALAGHSQSLALYRQLAIAALKSRDPQKASAMAQKALALAPLDQYALALQGSAWRVLGDERDEILNGYDDLIAVFDLEPPEGFSSIAAFHDELSAWLGDINPQTRAPLNQTLRGGSQTSGHLFHTGHELIDRLKTRISEAMRRYIEKIGTDKAHPFRSRYGPSFRFTGSWSSRLTGGGYHVNHIHPEGWISSCYYVSVPEAVHDKSERQGWIKFGEPSFDAGLVPRRAIQPVPGRLVLFPSYMWHGTNAFHDKHPRVTIAFDAVPVR